LACVSVESVGVPSVMMWALQPYYILP
jgi:hypothetical protein